LFFFCIFLVLFSRSIGKVSVVQALLSVQTILNGSKRRDVWRSDRRRTKEDAVAVVVVVVVVVVVTVVVWVGRRRIDRSRRKGGSAGMKNGWKRSH
jgi:hypothetical protein